MSYSYLLLFEFPSKRSGFPSGYTSYLIPNSEISYEERQTLQEMQMRGQLDFENYARPDEKKNVEVNAIVLYLFEKSDYIKHPKWEEMENNFVETRKRDYESILLKEFDLNDLGKWNKYKRKDNSFVEHNISAIYELIDNTSSYE